MFDKKGSHRMCDATITNDALHHPFVCFLIFQNLSCNSHYFGDNTRWLDLTDSLKIVHQ